MAQVTLATPGARLRVITYTLPVSFHRSLPPLYRPDLKKIFCKNDPELVLNQCHLLFYEIIPILRLFLKVKFNVTEIDLVTSFTFLFTGMGVSNMHTALGNKLKEVQSTTPDGWNFNEKQWAFIEAVLKDDLAHQTTHLQKFNKKVPKTSSEQ